MTNQQKIVRKMLHGPDDKFWYAKDFQDLSDPWFVGYEATARMSELHKDYPAMFEVAKDERFRIMRLKIETMSQWLPTISKELQEVFKDA